MSDAKSPSSPASKQTPSVPPPGAAPMDIANRYARRTYMARILLDVIGRPAAIVGLFWIAVMVFFAVFGPLVATSHALIARTADGSLVFPVWDYITPVDFTLIFGSLATLAIFLCKLTPRLALVVAVWGLTTAATALAAWTKAEPRTIVGIGISPVAVAVILSVLAVAAGGYATWGRRTAGGVLVVLLPVILGFAAQKPSVGIELFDSSRQRLAEGEFVWARFAPVPFSPQDRMRDTREDKRFQPPGTPHLVLSRVDTAGEERAVIKEWSHIMGTDRNGHDLASRLIHGSRVSLTIGFIATGIAVVIGVVIGALMGFFSGWVDLLGMRLVEIFGAIPVIYLLILVAAVYDRNIYLMMVIIGLTGWVGYATFIRAEFLKLRQVDYVQAAIALGVPLRLVLMRHMLPNGITPVLVSASFGVAGAILTESTLSFLGLGLPPGEPSWGGALNEAVGAGEVYPWIVILPGTMIFLTVLAYNLVGESLRDAIDPRTTRAA